MAVMQSRSEPLGARNTSPTGLRLASSNETPQPAERPEPNVRRQNQNLWLLLILSSALFAVTAGILYLSSYASLTREAYRRAILKGQLQSEFEKSVALRQQKAEYQSAQYIERQAKLLNMRLAKDSDSFVIGQAR